MAFRITLALAGVWALALCAGSEAHAAGSDYVCNRAGQTGPGGQPCALASIGEVNLAALPAGATVYLAAGDRFSDATLGARSGVTYTSYTPPQGAGPYGGTRAILAPAPGSNGVTFYGASRVTLDRLDLDGTDASSNSGDAVFSSERSRGPSTDDVIEHCRIVNWARGIETGYADSHWTVADNAIDTIALDGIYFARSAVRGGVGPRGDVVLGNLITNTGMFPHAGGNTDPVHGVYDDSVDSEVTQNTIAGFQSDGVSVRFRDSQVSDNVISGGAIGIAWFQEDAAGGTSRWTGNLISDVRSAGIYVCGARDGCTAPAERFVITDNTIVIDPAVPCLNLEQGADRLLALRDSCAPASDHVAALVNADYASASHAQEGGPW